MWLIHQKTIDFCQILVCCSLNLNIVIYTSIMAVTGIYLSMFFVCWVLAGLFQKLWLNFCEFL